MTFQWKILLRLVFQITFSISRFSHFLNVISMSIYSFCGNAEWHFSFTQRRKSITIISRHGEFSFEIQYCIKKIFWRKLRREGKFKTGGKSKKNKWKCLNSFRRRQTAKENERKMWFGWEDGRQNLFDISSNALDIDWLIS